MKPTLAVVYQSGMSTASFQEFADTLSDQALAVHLEEREDQGLFAGIVWTMLTAGAVFIASNYFGSMFKELGKEHYEKLRDALGKLTEKTMEHPRIEPVLVGSAGKLEADDPISMLFSVWAELPNGRAVKLLIPKNANGVEYRAMTDAFLEFVKRCHEEGESVLVEAGVDIARRGNPITVVYDIGSGKIEYANPFA